MYHIAKAQLATRRHAPEIHSNCVLLTRIDNWTFRYYTRYCSIRIYTKYTNWKSIFIDELKILFTNAELFFVFCFFSPPIERYILVPLQVDCKTYCWKQQKRNEENEFVSVCDAVYGTSTSDRFFFFFFFFLGPFFVRPRIITKANKNRLSANERKTCVCVASVSECA